MQTNYVINSCHMDHPITLIRDNRNETNGARLRSTEDRKTTINSLERILLNGELHPTLRVRQGNRRRRRSIIGIRPGWRGRGLGTRPNISRTTKLSHRPSDSKLLFLPSAHMPLCVCVPVCVCVRACTTTKSRTYIYLPADLEFKT